MTEPAMSAKRAPTLPSYRRRYAQIFVVLVILFAVIVGLTYRYVVTQSAASAEAAAVREAGINALNDAFAQLYTVRRDLHDFLLTPSRQHEQLLKGALQQLRDAMARLVTHDGRLLSDEFHAIGELLGEDTERLLGLTDELMGIRHDPERWFPASRLIGDTLQDNSNLFVSRLDALIHSLRQGPSDDIERLATLFELQKAWLRTIDELRLIIANRFRMFSADPVSGMRARQHDLQLYRQQVDELLASLRTAAASDDDGALLEHELAVLSGYARAWGEAYEVLVGQLESNDWRRDLQFLRDRVDPQLGAIRHRLEILRVELHTQRRQQIDALSRVSIGVGNVLFAALGVLLVFGIAGFLTLDRFILRPILALADSLKARAENDDKAAPTPPAVSETRDLLDAFDDMRHKVTQRERALDHLAHHDTLTGLPNRALFRRRLSEAIEHARRHRQLVGLLFMDLDRFKQVNDSHGHAAGDEMLREIGRRLSAVFRQDDLVARLGGDEFAVLLENIHAREEMTLLAEKALSAVERPYAFDGKLFYSGASMGIAVAPDDGTDPDRLIQLADAAMYASKKEEGSSYRFVSSDMSTLAAARHALESDLRTAIQQHQLQLYFQPVVASGDGSLHGYEALLRWPHAEQGLLSPASFMDALNDAGLCGTISDWALDQLHTRRPSQQAVVSINLSARLLHDVEFAQRLFERIDQGRLPPQQLILEITEDTLETDLHSAEQVLHGLKERGVRIALDDFGTGQASLSHLRRFPFDYVKIDQSFVAGIGKRPNDEKLIRAVIGLAHELDMRVVAEGVETAAQREFLTTEGCDYVQGYLVGRPSDDGRVAT